MAPIKFHVVDPFQRPLPRIRVVLELLDLEHVYEAETSSDPIERWSPVCPEYWRLKIPVDATVQQKYRITIYTGAYFGEGQTRWPQITIDLQGDYQMITLRCGPGSYEVVTSDSDSEQLIKELLNSVGALENKDESESKARSSHENPGHGHDLPSREAEDCPSLVKCVQAKDEEVKKRRERPKKHDRASEYNPIKVVLHQEGQDRPQRQTRSRKLSRRAASTSVSQ